MNVKDFITSIFSRKSSIAAVGIIALCYIATITSGQVSIEQSDVSIVPMTPALPPGEAAVVDWKICAEITLITCLAIAVQGLLDYIRPRGRKIYCDIGQVELKPPEDQN